nr:putative ribonuclease H-like domain-containing protein [Tanacetum cinerariifolium]
MEYWITNNDMNIWKVIQNGNSLKRTRRDRVRKSIPDDHIADFYYTDDVRDIRNAVKARMQKILSQLNKLKSNPEDEDINLKFLRALPSSWSQMSKDTLLFPQVNLLDQAILHLSGNVIKDVLQSFVADTQPEQQLAYEDFKQLEKLDLEEMDLKYQMAMLSIRVHKFEQKAGRKIDFDKKESARAKGGNDEQRYSSFKIKEIGNKEEDSKALITIDTLVDWTDHDSKSDGVIAAKEFGMIDGCDFEDAIEEGASKIYNLITRAYTEEAGTADDVGQFALVGVTFVENELGWDDSTFSVFTTNSKDVEGRPLFNRPQPVPTGKPKVFAPVPAVRQNRPFPVPTNRAYSPSVSSGWWTSGKVTFRGGEGRITGKGTIRTPTGSIPVPTGSIPVSAGDTMVSTDDVPVYTSSSTDLFFNDEPTTRFPCPSDLGNHDPSPRIFSSSSYNNEFGAVLNNVASTVEVNPILKNKREAKGIVVQNKARRVAQGHIQEDGIDYNEVFTPVATIKAIRLFLAFTSYMGFLVYQMDVKSAFLYKGIDEEIYITNPKGFMDPQYLKKVYKVVKALYGLHQAPRAWYATLSTFLLKHGYRRCTIDKTLFLKKNSRDIILGEFQMSAIGELTFFICLQVQQRPDGIFINQDKYVQEILNKFDLRSVRMTTTPYEAPKPKSKNEFDSFLNVHMYRSMIGSLMYLTALRPDIMFAVSACSRNQFTSTTSNLEAVKKIFKYLKGQPKLGLWYPKESPLVLKAYSDSDYARANKDRKSTTGGCQFLGRRLISWQCKKQT